MSISSALELWTQVIQDVLASKKELSLQLSALESLEALQALRANYVGRRSLLFKSLQNLRDAPVELRKNFGQQLKSLRIEMEALIEVKQAALQKAYEEAQLTAASIDVSLPGISIAAGSLHPITQTIDAIVAFFRKCGFQIASGPEIESAHYNFEALNLPKEHPAQAEQDSFWLSQTHLLRTHTSGIQIRTLEMSQPPLRILAPGRVYRPDSDMTHTPMFHQIEGLLVQEEVTFADLKGLIHACLQEIFQEDSLQVRFRPSDFPFTVPSAEVDLKLPSYGEEWLEVLGCGMVHPAVLERIGIDTTRFKGFAFGLGVERFAMLRHKIPDLRTFYENDLRFLKQFA